MKQVEIYTCDSSIYLQNSINNWIKENNINVVEVKFSSQIIRDDPYYIALIIYEV